MRLRYFWRDCSYRNKNWGSTTIDCFWVEATRKEAETDIFPRLQQIEISDSRELAEKFNGLAEALGEPAHPFCFLVARDVSAIDPLPVHYPFHQMWNAFSPFEMMQEINIHALDNLATLELPPPKENE